MSCDEASPHQCRLLDDIGANYGLHQTAKSHEAKIEIEKLHAKEAYAGDHVHGGGAA
jgi:hypothetical protein